jgi:D-3-phosphoglycerate dehydrogenase
LKKKILCITPLEPFIELSQLENYGTVIYDPNINKSDMGSLLRSDRIEYIFTNPNKQGFMIDEGVLRNTNVKVINTCSTGTNHIDLKYCELKGIDVWSLARDFEIINQLPSTSELALGLMIGLLRYIPRSFDSVKNNQWDYTKFIGRQISGLTIGIIGYGRLGKFMARYCQCLGARVVIYDPFCENDDKIKQYNNYDQLEDIVKICDVISLHTHVKDDTKNSINSSLLKNAKKGLYIINTARGEIVNERDIIDGLRSNQIAGYATDVISDEFGDITGSPILKGVQEGLNIIVTPHIGGMSLEGPKKTYSWAINKFKSIIET